MSVSDQRFIENIESLKLKPCYFTHEGHIRLAWLYLKEYELSVAVSKTCQTIKTFAESLGAHTKFHMTITSALVHIIHAKMLDEDSWQSFIDNNSKLIDNSFEELHNYYDLNTLKSEYARLNFVLPKKSFKE